MQFNAHPTRSKISRRQMIASATALAAVGAMPLSHAQSAWKPSGPIKLVVPYSAGGATDILARMVAPGLSERFGQPVIVENRPGATGTIGAGLVYGAPADGTTLLVAVPDMISIYPNLAKTSYDPTRFVPVANLGTTAFVLLARPGLPAKNLQEVISQARKQPLNFGNAGMGGSVHLMTLAFGLAASIPNMTHVPYVGMAPAIQGLLGDHIDFYFSAVGGATQYQSKLKYLGVSSAQRVNVLPDVPTFTEQGLKLVQDLWFGVLAPPNTPRPIVEELNKAISDVVQTATYTNKAAEYAVTVPRMTQPEFARYYEQDFRNWSDIIRVGKVKLD